MKFKNPEDRRSASSRGLDKVAHYWDGSNSHQQKLPIAWMEHPNIQRYINIRTTGNPEEAWFSYINQKYAHSRLGNVCSLGCGTGGLERHALSLSMAETIDAFDISPKSIALAKNAAEDLGFGDKCNYMVSDLNELCLNPQKYDAVFASMSIHHICDLEHLFGQICLSLREGGFFICNEYIGPTRFQLSVERLQIINHLLTILPIHYRRIIRSGKATSDIKIAHNNPTLSWFEENDPSEAVRSGDILKVLPQYFNIFEYTPYGGGILHFLLENIVGNFQDNREDDSNWLDMLTYLELLFEEKGFIDSDFAIIVGTPIKSEGRIHNSSSVNILSQGG